MKGNTSEAYSINGHLDALRFKVYETECNMLKQKLTITATSFRDAFFGVEEKQKTIIPIFQDHNARMKSLIGKKFTHSTHTKYETTLKHLQVFLKVKYNKTDLNVKDIKISFINDFDFYLRVTKNCNNNTTVKYVRNLGKIVKICFANEWLAKDPLLQYEGSMEEVDIVPLNDSELQTMYSKNIEIPRLELVRDIYIFSCFTGLAYIDVEQLTEDKISYGIDGGKWIFTHRQKTDNPSNIPLLPIAEEILEKYKNHPKCLNSSRLLPILSNQKMNSYLKEVADICGIRKELTFHTARHTFATTVTLGNGVPMESVSKMLGHKSLRTTQHYAKVMDKKVSEDMALLKERLIIQPRVSLTNPIINTMCENYMSL